MKIKNLVVFGTLVIAVLVATAGNSHAGIMFKFTESGGSVFMATSGTLETANLVAHSVASWGGTGIETNPPPESDIMGDTSMGGVNTAFGFHSGTDYSPWIGGMFGSSVFGWSSSGTTSFTTYIRDPIRTPGIGIRSGDMSGSLWTPDVSWSKAGSFASFSMTEGTYTITDAVTSESITIQIGAAPVPEPASLAIFGTICLLGFGRRRKS